MSGIKITPEITGTNHISYLIRKHDVINKTHEEVNLVERENDARLAIDSLAAYLTKEMANEWTKVYREDVGNNKIVISTQALGYIANGFITESCIIDYIPLSFVSVEKGRFEKESVIPVPPPLPPAEQIARNEGCVVRCVFEAPVDEYEDELESEDESGDDSSEDDYDDDSDDY